MAVYYSRVTRKGHATIPSELRKKFAIETDDKEAFEETTEVWFLKPAADIEDSADALSRFAVSETVLDDHLRDREKDFR